MRERLQNAMSLYLMGMGFFFMFYGLNDLLVPATLTIVSYGGILAAPQVWGWVFLLTGLVISHAAMRPDLRGLHRISLSLLVGVTCAWFVVRVVIVVATGRDFTSIGFRGMFLFSDIIAILTVEHQGFGDIDVFEHLSQWLQKKMQRTTPLDKLKEERAG